MAAEDNGHVNAGDVGLSNIVAERTDPLQTLHCSAVQRIRPVSSTTLDSCGLVPVSARRPQFTCAFALAFTWVPAVDAGVLVNRSSLLSTAAHAVVFTRVATHTAAFISSAGEDAMAGRVAVIGAFLLA